MKPYKRNIKSGRSKALADPDFAWQDYEAARGWRNMPYIRKWEHTYLRNYIPNYAGLCLGKLKPSLQITLHHGYRRPYVFVGGSCWRYKEHISFYYNRYGKPDKRYMWSVLQERNRYKSVDLRAERLEFILRYPNFNVEEYFKKPLPLWKKLKKKKKRINS